MTGHCLNRIIELYLKLVLHFRWWVILLVVLLVITASSGIGRLLVNDDYRAFFSPDDPNFKAFQAVEATYSDTDPLLLVITPDETYEDVFNPEVIEAIKVVTQRSWLLPYVVRVDSITNFQYSHSVGDDLIIEDLFDNARPLSHSELKSRRRIALEEPQLRDRLVAPNGSVTAVMLTFQHVENRTVEQLELVHAARALIRELEGEFDSLSFRLTGDLMVPVAFREATENDYVFLVPALLISVFIIIYIFFRSWVSVVAVFLVLIFSTLTAFGIAGWLKIPLSATSAPSSNIIMTVAVADCIHILSSFFALLHKGRSRIEAMAESVRTNFFPVMLTSLTTALGVLTFNFNESPNFHHLGNITAIGVVSAWLFSITLLPSFMAIFNLRHKTNSPLWLTKSMSKLGGWVVAQKAKLLMLTCCLSVIAISMIFLNKAEDQIIQYFDKDIEFRRDSDYTLDKLTGVYRIIFSLPAHEPNGVVNPEYLQKIERFEHWLKMQQEVRHVESIVPIFKRLNMNMHGDSQEYYRLPEDKELAAQYMLLYELSLPFGLGLTNQIDLSKSSSKLVITLNDLTSTEIRNFEKRIAEWFQTNTPSLLAPAVGPSVMFSHISERTIRSMIWGAVIGVFAISLALILALKSVKFGLLSLLTNLLPAGLALGVWGGMVGQVNMAVSVVMTLTLGIVVDDTVHFLNRYLKGRKNSAMGGEEAIIYTFSSVGGALLITSVALFVGFAILGFSDFAVNAQLAQITGLTIIFALLVDFFMLPALILIIDKKKHLF